MTTGREGGEGWGFPSLSRKPHYFTPDGRSLCRKYGFGWDIPLEPDRGIRSPDDCTPCAKALVEREAPKP